MDFFTNPAWDVGCSLISYDGFSVKFRNDVERRGRIVARRLGVVDDASVWGLGAVLGGG